MRERGQRERILFVIADGIAFVLYEFGFFSYQCNVNFLSLEFIKCIKIKEDISGL